MSTDQNITASCAISHQIVYKNGVSIFEKKDADLTSFLLSAYNNFALQYPKFYKMDNLAKLGMIASEVLLKPGFRSADYLPEKIGVVLTNANSSLDTDLKYFETVGNIASPSLFVYTLPNIVIGEICIRNNFKGENAFFVFSQFDANFIHSYVSNLLAKKILEACVCGWVEVMGQDYKAVLFLVEKKTAVSQTRSFTIENINKIYALENG